MIVRTYETVSIVWERVDADGTPYTTSWTGSDREHAECTVAASGGRARLEIGTFEVEIPVDKLHLYRLGIAERVQ